MNARGDLSGILQLELQLDLQTNRDEHLREIDFSLGERKSVTKKVSEKRQQEIEGIST